MRGYANTNGVTIEQQVISNGASGNSVNNVSIYSSSANCIGMRYPNQNGGELGLLTARLTSFIAGGFTLNVTSTTFPAATDEPLVVIYEAYRN